MTKQTDPIKPPRHLLGRPIVYRLGTRFIGYAPTWMTYWCVRRVAEVSYLFCKTARENVKKNLKKAFPTMSNAKLSSLAINTFRNYSEYLVDYGRFRTLDSASLCKTLKSLIGREHIEEARRRANGVIVLTVHLGNWELGAIFFGRQGLRMNVVASREGSAGIDELKQNYRRLHNINTVILGDSPFSTIELLQALKRNEAIAMLVDRHGPTSGHSVKCDFFNAPFNFPAGPLILAKATGASIVSAVVVKGKTGYRSVISEPIVVGDEEEFQSCAQRIMTGFESFIREYPDQWYNFVEV
ncbi:MAG: lysophospholipid acyltransferase family protein [Deltaproteobacteria bacterium]|nr:lysophospholipid acyltransferase family protein [Deltaproteobacteria bacterium]